MFESIIPSFLFFVNRFFICKLFFVKTALLCTIVFVSFVHYMSLICVLTVVFLAFFTFIFFMQKKNTQCSNFFHKKHR